MITLPNQQQQQQHPQQQQQMQMQAQQQTTMQIQTPQHNRQISPMNARATPQPPQSAQQIYYTPARANAKAPGGAPPSAKRLKPTPPGGHNPAAAAAQAAALGVDPSMTIDEEEDTSRGDMLDHLSPREIATTRYIQHHEWMEEIMGSPYAIDKIEPVDLGLGLRGELEIVTKGLLDPPAYPPIPKPPRTGDATREKENSQAEILEELRPRVEAKIREMEAEMLRMQDAHAKRLQKIKQSGVTKDAELKLRIGLGLTPQQQPEIESHQVYTPGNEMEDCHSEPATTATVAAIKDLSAVEEIVHDVEYALGKKVVEKRMLAKHDLPVEEIIKMGGIVAEGDGQPNPDTVMTEDQDGSSHNNGNQQDDDARGNLNGSTTVDDEFNLALGNMPDENGTDSSHQSEIGFSHVLDGAADVPPPPQAATARAQEEEDTIMNDFMNVDQDSKPDTPNVEEKKEKDPENTATSTTPPAPATTAATATATTSPRGTVQQQQSASEDAAPAAAAFMFSPPTEKATELTIGTTVNTSASGGSGGPNAGIPGLGMEMLDGKYLE